MMARVLHCAGDGLSRRRRMYDALTVGAGAFLGPSDAAALAGLTPLARPSAPEVVRLTGPLMLTECLVSALRQGGPEVSGLVVFPVDVLHPVPNTVDVDVGDEASTEELKRRYLTERSLAVHWWQRSWQRPSTLGDARAEDGR